MVKNKEKVIEQYLKLLKEKKYWKKNISWRY